jgi:hypothetical protein
VTIHKSQGSEYPAVVIPVTTQHYAMLQRNLLYTGLTRGKKLVVLVGQKKAVAIASTLRSRPVPSPNSVPAGAVFFSASRRVYRFCHRARAAAPPGLRCKLAIPGSGSGASEFGQHRRPHPVTAPSRARLWACAFVPSRIS